MQEPNLILRDKIFRFLFDMPRGSSFEIKTAEQMTFVKEFIQIHGYTESVGLNKTSTRVKKHKFLTKDYKRNKPKRNLLKPE